MLSILLQIFNNVFCFKVSLTSLFILTDEPSLLVEFILFTILVTKFSFNVFFKSL